MPAEHRMKPWLGILLALLVAPALQAGPQIQSWETSNGARVLYLPADQLPMVDVQVLFDAGSTRDGDAYGLAVMTAGLLEEGAGGLSGQEISRRFDAIGASFGVSAERDSASVTLRSLSDASLLSEALATAATVIRAPDFPQTAFERERSRMLVGLQAKKQDPGTLASEAFFKAIYGNHPYAHPTSGNEQTIVALTPDQLRAFHRRYYVGRNAVVAIVGDVNRREAESIAETLIGRLPAGEAAAPLPEVVPLNAAKTVRVPFASTQNHVLVGQPGLKRGDPDYFRLYVANHVLGGGGFVSRLTEEIREQRGLAYSVYSYFMPMRELGPFQMGLQTRNDQAEEALGLMRGILDRYLAEGPTAEELEGAILNITGGFPLRIDSNRDLVGYLAMIGFHRLPLDYLDRFNREVASVTREQAHEAMKRRLDPGRMVTVIVGGGDS